MMAVTALDELIATDSGHADDGALSLDSDVSRVDSRQIELDDPTARGPVHVSTRREVEAANFFETIELHPGIVAKWKEVRR